MRWLTVGLEHAKIQGPMFRRLIGAEQIGGTLNLGAALTHIEGRLRLESA